MERTVTCAALSTLVADRVKIALLDVRRQPAFDADPRLIPGAVWQDPEQVGTWAGTLNRDQPVVVYCVHGHEVSRDARDALRRQGFDAKRLAGGLEGWKAAGGRVVPAARGDRP
jgi:rhodanese-related sulfurtransferase